MRRRVPYLAIATVLVVGGTYLRWSPPATQAAASPNAAALAASATQGRAETARLVADYEREVTDTPTASGLKFLAQLYLQRGRLTGDVATYVQARTALDRAIVLAPEDLEARGLLAGVLATTHDFERAADKARSVLAASPDNMGAAAVLGDAQLELGDYDGARITYQALAAQQPDAAAVIVRQARLAFLTGDVASARQLARRAKDQASASAFGDVGLAFYTTFQGQIEHDTGHYAGAEQYYRQALREAPGYYIALAGLARERAAQGHTTDAIARFRQAIATVPQPDALAALGDLYTLRHDEADARIQYDTIAATATLADINRQVYNRALATYEADHDVAVDEALRLAEGELTVRRDVYGYDIDAWALYKNHRYDDAKRAADRALALGTPDARLLYHAGMIDAALGADGSAIDRLGAALRISPRFDPVQVATARATLAALERKARP